MPRSNTTSGTARESKQPISGARPLPLGHFRPPCRRLVRVASPAGCVTLVAFFQTLERLPGLDTGCSCANARGAHTTPQADSAIPAAAKTPAERIGRQCSRAVCAIVDSFPSC